MTIHATQATDQDNNYVHSNLFGEVQKTLIDEVEGKQLEDVFLRLLRLRDEVFHAPAMNAQAPIQDYMSINDEFRALVGALYFKLNDQLEKDIKETHAVIANFWQCLRVTLVRRNMNPQKYHTLCGTPFSIYGLNVTRMANLDPKDELVKKWKLQSWESFDRSIFSTKNQLMEKEKEYRDTAIAIAQIGLGLGGMLIGVIGLLLSVLLTIFSLFLTILRST